MILKIGWKSIYWQNVCLWFDKQNLYACVQLLRYPLEVSGVSRFLSIDLAFLNCFLVLMSWNDEFKCSLNSYYLIKVQIVKNTKAWLRMHVIYFRKVFNGTRVQTIVCKMFYRTYVIFCTPSTFTFSFIDVFMPFRFIQICNSFSNKVCIAYHATSAVNNNAFYFGNVSQKVGHTKWI